MLRTERVGTENGRRDQALLRCEGAYGTPFLREQQPRTCLLAVPPHVPVPLRCERTSPKFFAGPTHHVLAVVAAVLSCLFSSAGWREGCTVGFGALLTSARKMHDVDLCCLFHCARGASHTWRQESVLAGSSHDAFLRKSGEAMKRSYEIEMAQSVYIPAEETTCESCGRGLVICEHRERFVHRRDDVYRVVRQIKWCQTKGCVGFHKTYAPLVDLRLAPPLAIYGTDVLVELGERHLSQNESLSAIGRDLNRRGIPVSQKHTTVMFRSYIALTKAARGDDEELRARLREQGGIVLMVDGVQYDSNSPVLYILWDAISGEVLFGERKQFRAADDLVPLLEKVKAMDVPIISVVSDKEKGLQPAIATALPNVPNQLCQQHFLKNCALGTEKDCQELGETVAARAEKVQKIAKSLHEKGFDSVEYVEMEPSQPSDERHSSPSNGSPSAPILEPLSEPTPQKSAGPACNAVEPPPSTAQQVEEQGDQPAAPDSTMPLSEEQLAAELCAMARGASRATGRAPLNPPELVRHKGLEKVRAAVLEAKKKEEDDGAQPFLDKLDEALRPDWHASRVAGRVSRHVEILRELAHEISPSTERSDPPANGDEAHKRMQDMLQRLRDEAPRSGLGAATGTFVDHVAGVAERYGRQLFYCFDDPRTPSTTNGLEGLFGASKSQIRGALGEASTTNGVAQNLGADYLDAFVYTRTHSQGELLEALPSIAISAYQAARRLIDKHEQPARLRRSRRRDPDRHLKQLVTRYLPRPASLRS